MSSQPAGDSPYLHHADYWLAAAQAGEYPVGQGDLFADVQTADGAHLDAALIVHPTCELGKASVTNVQVARVQPLDALPDENQRQQVVAGISEKDGGLRIAFAHTFFVAPVEGSALPIPMWADFRELVLGPASGSPRTRAAVRSATTRARPSYGATCISGCAGC